MNGFWKELIMGLGASVALALGGCLQTGCTSAQANKHLATSGEHWVRVGAAVVKDAPVATVELVKAGAAQVINWANGGEDPGE